MTLPWEIENFIDVRDGQLHIDGVSAADLAREHGTPLFVFSEARIRHNIARLQKAQGVIGCPLKVCYAAKAMSTMAILRTIKDAGCDIEVNSGGELWKALKAGFTGDQIIFNGTSKEVWEIENAINVDIYAIQVDSLYELTLIEETAKRLNKKANVSLRLVPEIETDTHSGLQTALLTSKFGMMPDEAFAAFRDYKDSPHLAMNGIHLHVGSQNPEPSVYTAAFAALFDGVARILIETGVRLKHINIGGGFPVNYLGDATQAAEMPTSVVEMLAADFEPAEALSTAWNNAAIGREELLKDLTILVEPGRSIIADTAICLTTVRNHKTRPVATSSPPYEGGVAAASADGVVLSSHQPTTDHWLLTDAGFNILLSMETYKWYYHLISATRSTQPHSTPYKLAGPLCDGGDVYFDIEGQYRLPDHRMLPESVQPGEVLALLNCGAYSLAQASQYNCRFLPAVVLVREDGVAELIRKRDEFADLINNDNW
ncbi:MAG: diaminopimelate decarboxylase [Acidobacteria bacterium]|nr:diaminopimelate decarboxylase [Acidobacteriota bacterium]